MIADPPFDVGGVQLTASEPLPAVAVTPVGAPGRVNGTSDADADEGALVPAELVAVTLKVYELPFVSPVIWHEVPLEVQVPTALPEPSYAVAVYEVIVPPPLSLGAVQLTVALPFPAVAVTPVGAPGATVCGVIVAEGSDGLESPFAFVATALKVYEEPFVRPVTMHDVLGAVAVQVPAALPEASYAVMVYDVTEPLGAVQETVALPLPATAVTLVGASGGLGGDVDVTPGVADCPAWVLA